ncbi:Bacteriophage%2C scaffolding protein [Serratia marcescens]|uniref:phage capsid protein n=1 Tax=Serratia marcescens TaxID=615 RepID=UPI000745509F|nr:phage capsid protein [Serratia marcescens]CUZ06387.1 Bacteriophage%2C scaffolding protein [Serratia marcescens]CUZ35159.1 Bacteriophage%2C scaffolding protein [Serratia marcescens]CUZ35927.1 Bacteriophage%2C scaffolding protein [Serratia marcescens]CUZ36912.1 Bacteriophage%2C scaffolding protein [Serratia marcescens]CVA03881.1 Bacteriophage%2C scaffolding protein [Serratia marcescens]
MESELIIDGQVIDRSEKQEEAEEVITEAKGNPEEKSQEEPEQKEKKAESEQPEEQPDDYSLQIGDEEISLNHEEDDHIDGQPAPQWVKELRKGFKETQKENRELRRQLEQIQSKPAEAQQPQSDVIPPKPTLESCEYDEEAFEQAMTDWHEKKGRAEQVKQQQQRQQQELQQRLTERLTKHQERAAKLPVKDYREMEDIVRQEIPVIQQEILIHAADEGSELVAYALGKNQQLRQRVAAETDPIRAAFLLGQISQQVKLAPKPKKAIKPEPEVRGGGADAKQDDFNKLCPGAKIE